MIDRKISVHLQDFPDVSFLQEETDLVADMDLVRSICSTALSIRDNKNLRVRLPLRNLTVFGKNAERILAFKDIIAEEINVKSIEIKEDIADLAEVKPQVNFKRIGSKYSSKMKEITTGVRNGEWKTVGEDKIEVGGLTLVDDEFEMKLTIKKHDSKKFAILALPTNDYLVQLDIEITKELEDEGIARDIVRAIQQNRKDANLDVSNRINLKLFSTNSRILDVAKEFTDYISAQVLADSLNCVSAEEDVSKVLFSCENKLDDGDLTVGLSVS